MAKRYLVFGASMAAVAGMWLSAQEVGAQRGATRPPEGASHSTAKPIPRMADGKPDLNGVWISGEGSPNPTTTSLAQRLEEQRKQEAAGKFPGLTPLQRLYKPDALAKMKALSDKDDPGLKCVPSVTGHGGEWQFVHTPKVLAILNETYHNYRIVPTAPGSAHQDDFPPSYLGDSVGRWEGDTLVIDAKNFNDRNWIFSEGQVSFHSDALHVVERYRPVDGDTLELERTFEDPKLLTGPLTTRTTLERAPFDQIMELMCFETASATLMETAAKENYGKQPPPASSTPK